MKKLVFGLLAVIILCSNDMFLKFDNYFLNPQSEAVLQLFNGTFDESENIIDRDRMLDASMVGGGFRFPIDSAQWYDENLTTYLKFETGKDGTWVAGVSTAPRNISMKAEKFNDYLEHDGVDDMLLKRKNEGKLNSDTTEKYSKHVKTIFQVGDERSNDWATNLGYPIEFIPLSNPYSTHVGHSIKVKLLRDGKPLPNQTVLIGNDKNQAEHTHDDGEPHSHDNGQKLRTDAGGILEFNLSNSGIWHLRTIHMEEVDDAELTHESNWATLTFAVKKEDGHNHESDGHSHDEADHDVEFPAYTFWIISFIVIVILFLYFRNRKSNNG